MHSITIKQNTTRQPSAIHVVVTRQQATYSINLYSIKAAFIIIEKKQWFDTFRANARTPNSFKMNPLVVATHTMTNTDLGNT